MDFYIHSDRYFLKEREDRSFFIMALATNQPISLDSSLHPLLHAADKWVNFESFVQLMQIASFLQPNFNAMMEDAVLSMHAAGIADIKNMPSFGGNGIRWASLRDYYAVSDFTSENYNRGRSCTVAFGKPYFSYRVVYDAIKSGEKYMLLKEHDGQILAAAIFGFSSRFFGSRVFELKSFVFGGERDAQVCREDVSELVAYARESLKGKTRKLRYEYINQRQSFIADALKSAGFGETARFQGELKNGADLVLLDLPVE